jgi:hypothetical protein
VPGVSGLVLIGAAARSITSRRSFMLTKQRSCRNGQCRADFNMRGKGTLKSCSCVPGLCGPGIPAGVPSPHIIKDVASRGSKPGKVREPYGRRLPLAGMGEEKPALRGGWIEVGWPDGPRPLHSPAYSDPPTPAIQAVALRCHWSGCGGCALPCGRRHGLVARMANC